MNKIPYRLGTSSKTIIADGWSRDFNVKQTLSELHQMGYKSYTIWEIEQYWQLLENDFKAYNNGCV